MCTYGFGGHTSYLGAGSYGVTYEKKIGLSSPDGATTAGVTTGSNPDGDPGSDRTIEAAAAAVVKLAAIEADAGKAISKRLSEGDDASVESFYFEAMMHIMAATNMPHVSIGYGVWACPNVLKLPRPLLYPALTCKKMRFEVAKSV
jgi:hypothetical protein